MGILGFSLWPQFIFDVNFHWEPDLTPAITMVRGFETAEGPRDQKKYGGQKLGKPFRVRVQALRCFVPTKAQRLADGLFPPGLYMLKTKTNMAEIIEQSVCSNWDTL